MKTTGIIRRIDELGRMVIPKEIQRALDIREGDPIEVFIGREGEISLRNEFDSKEETEWMLEHLRLIKEMKEWIRENDNDFKPDWEDVLQGKFILRKFKNDISCDICWGINTGLEIYFSSESKAEEAIEYFGEERILKYYFPN